MGQSTNVAHVQPTPGSGDPGENGAAVGAPGAFAMCMARTFRRYILTILDVIRNFILASRGPTRTYKDTTYLIIKPNIPNHFLRYSLMFYGSTYFIPL